MLLVAVELGEVFNANEFPVGPHEFVVVVGNPSRNRLMMTLASANERRAEIKVFGALCFRSSQDFVQKLPQGTAGKWSDPLIGIRLMLHAEPRVEQPQILRD